MRLDRILFKGNATVRKIEKILDQPMFEQEGPYQRIGFLKGSLSFASDVFGYNLFRRKERYLFPSDHFGLYCEFDLFGSE